MSVAKIKDFMAEHKVAIGVILAIIVFSIYFTLKKDGFDNISGLDNVLPSDINNANTYALNPIDQNIDMNQYNIEGVNQSALNQLIREVNMGTTIPVISNSAINFQNKVNGPNKTTTFSKRSYADSNYRMNSNDNGTSNESQSKLDKLYNDAVVFRDSEYQNNSNFVGNSENIGNYANANLGGSSNTLEAFEAGGYANADLNAYKSGPETQSQQIMNMFNSNNYLPKNVQNTDGFQILNNPVSVDNPNLIPVLRAMPVATTVGNKRNMSRDIRGDPSSNPKLVVAPWNNSSIQPDIYSTNRGCL